MQLWWVAFSTTWCLMVAAIACRLTSVCSWRCSLSGDGLSSVLTESSVGVATHVPIALDQLRRSFLTAQLKR